ncbi:MAG: hypothetical protein ACRD2O_15200 [Terriglobia bacterium]
MTRKRSSLSADNGEPGIGVSGVGKEGKPFRMCCIDNTIPVATAQADGSF